MERTVKNFDSDQCRISFFLQQCAKMDALPIERRQKALAFARAMTALEGLPTSEKTEQDLLLWAKGERRFADVYMKFLQSYSVIEDDWTTKVKF